MNKPPLAEILVRQFDADVGRAMQYMAEHDCEWEVALVRSCPNSTPSGIARELLTSAASAEYERAASAASAAWAEYNRAESAAWAEFVRAWSAVRAEYHHRCAEIFVAVYRKYYV